MNIGIIGKGVVGSAVFEGLKLLGHNMCVHDPKFNTELESIIDTDLVFLCVPTDSTLTGDCDTSIVEQVCKELSTSNYNGLVCIKSTVIPGTTQRLSNKFSNLRICCVPEFLKAKTALEDFTQNHDVLVVGSNNNDDANLVIESHKHLPKNIIVVQPNSAEMIKYFNNVHNAMEITFANIISSICDKLNIDYQEVYNGISLRHNINSSYLKSGPEWGAFGGHCLPKDTLALHNLINSNMLNYQLIEAILSDNERFKK